MAAEYNLYIDQGVTFSTEITISDDNGIPVDLTNATLASQVRKSYTSTVAFPFTITVLGDPTMGQVVLSMTATQTAAMAAGRYVYDAQYNINGVVTRFLKGLVTIFPAVTQT
jgi:hypothetical protein